MFVGYCIIVIIFYAKYSLQKRSHVSCLVLNVFQRIVYVGCWSVFTICGYVQCVVHYNTDNKFHGANMGPTWVLSAPSGPHVGPTNLAIRERLLINANLVQSHNLNLLRSVRILWTNFNIIRIEIQYGCFKKMQLKINAVNNRSIPWLLLPWLLSLVSRQ